MATKPAELTPGTSRSVVLVENLTRTQIVMYAGASGDFTPLHTDEPFARHAGYPSVFAHGMLTMAMTGTALTDWFGVENLKEFGARFLNQVWPGDTLTATLEVTSVEPSATSDGQIVELKITTTNQDDIAVLSATARVVSTS